MISWATTYCLCLCQCNSCSHLQLVTCGEQGVMFSVICFKTTRWHWGMLAMYQRRSSTTKSRLRAPTAPTYSSITCLLTLMTANLQRPFALSVLSFRPKYSSTKRQICLNVLVSSAENCWVIMGSFSLISYFNKLGQLEKCLNICKNLSVC